MKTSKLFLFLIIVAILLSACSNNTTTTASTETLTDSTDEIIEEATYLFRNPPETVDFHGIQLVKEEIPSWLLNEVIDTHKSTCDIWPEAELVNCICGHISNYLVGSFEIHEISSSTEEPTLFEIHETSSSTEEPTLFVSYNSETRRLIVGQTICDIDKPTVNIDGMDTKSINELEHEEGFDWVLKIIEKINDPNQSSTAAEKNATASRFRIFCDYMEKGWGSVEGAAQESLLTLIPTEEGSWRSAFWTKGHKHYIEVLASENDEEGFPTTRKIQVDGEAISLLPDKVVEEDFSPTTAIKIWGQEYTDSKEYSNMEVFCDKKGTFFTMSTDLQVYTSPWNLGETYWLPTSYYPAFGDKPVYKIENNLYLVASETKAEIFFCYERGFFGEFGAEKRYEIEFQDEVIIFGGTNSVNEVFVASPGKSLIWKIQPRRVSVAKCDQVVATETRVFLLEKNMLYKVARKKYDSLIWDDYMGVVTEKSLSFEDVVTWGEDHTALRKKEGIEISTEYENDIIVLSDKNTGTRARIFCSN